MRYRPLRPALHPADLPRSVRGCRLRNGGIALLTLLTAALLAGPALAHGVTPDDARSSDALPSPSAQDLLPDLPEAAISEQLREEEGPQVEARLLVASGPRRAVGVLFELAPGWHLYWRNPGGTGLAPRLRFEAPGYRLGELVWPAPRTFEEADGLFTTYGYEGSVLLSAALERSDPTAPAVPGATVGVKADVLVCRTECVPISFSLASPVRPGLPTPQQARIDALFEDARARAPRLPGSVGLAVSAAWDEAESAVEGNVSDTRRIRLRLEPQPSCRPQKAVRAGDPQSGADCARPPDAADSPFFLPIDAERFEWTGARLGVTPSRTGTNGFEVEIDAVVLEPDASRLHGLVPIRLADGGRHHVEVDVPIGSTRAAGGAGAGTGLAGWARVLLLALVGGLILNGMPCVLPVLAIKVVSIADMAERDRRDVRLQGLAYTLGVLGSMTALAAFVIALRAAGHSVGWGFQFQEPLFVAVICAVVVAFALNLFGVFEIDLGQGRLATLGQEGSAVRRSLFEGLLAVVLATPCTAPFLGTAVGFAFAAPGAGIMAIFATIGLGLALPFLVVSFAPGLARFIPRSGPWMLKLRAGLGWTLIATSLWLLWILSRSGGGEAVVATLAVLVVLSFLLWIYGQLQPLRSAWLARGLAFAIAGFAVVGFDLVGLDRAGEDATQPGVRTSDPTTPDAHGWIPWSQAGVERALATGRPVFVAFSADWCLTCQVNERTVLEREEIRTALRAGDYALFKADWTLRDETIRRKLAEFGRAGVPLYLVYSPDAPRSPQVLSELLSRREVLAAIAGPEDRTRI